MVRVMAMARTETWVKMSDDAGMGTQAQITVAVQILGFVELRLKMAPKPVHLATISAPGNHQCTW